MMNETGRFYRIMFAVFGPAQTGPYGPPVPPPLPRLRNAHGRLVSARKIAKLRYAETIASMPIDGGSGESLYPV